MSITPENLWFNHPADGWTCLPYGDAMSAAFVAGVSDTLCETPATWKVKRDGAATAPQRTDEYFREKGFVAFTADTWFPPGTKLIGYGENKARAAVVRHADLPVLGDAVAAFDARIASEQREWRDVKVTDLFLDDGFTFRRRVGAGLSAPVAVEPAALWRILSRFGRAFPGTSAAWKSIATDDPDHFRALFNRRLPALGSYGYKPADVGGRMLLRRVNGVRQVFAVHSDAYMPLSPAAGLRAIAEGVDGMDIEDPRASIVYDAATTQFRASVSYHADFETMIREGVGTAYEGGLAIRTDDRGGSTFRISPFVLRCICVNLTTVAQYGDAFEIRHRTSRRLTPAAIAAGMRRISDGAISQVRHLDTAARAYGRDVAAARTVEIAPIDTVLRALSQIRDSVIDRGDRRLFTDDRLVAAWDATRAETGDAERALTGEDVINVFTRVGTLALDMGDLQRWQAREATAVLVPAMAARART